MRRRLLLVFAALLAACGAESPPPATVARSAPSVVRSSGGDDETGFRRLARPAAGQWRAEHPEESAGSFEDYVASEPVRADGDRSALAFLPVGPFDEKRRAALESAVEFAHLWFNLPVRTMPGEPLTEDEDQFRDRDDGVGAPWRQYRTRWFLNDLLPNRLPPDAVVLVGVTMSDLWPGMGWNFVFGEADLRRRVGVYSLARYDPEFDGGASTPQGDRLALLRTLKVLVHEVGHTFGLEHCTEFECAMNGSNSMRETDQQPLHLCPPCLRKLAWNRGFGVAERYRKLAAFLDAHGFPEEAAWNRARAGSAR